MGTALALCIVHNALSGPGSMYCGLALLSACCACATFSTMHVLANQALRKVYRAVTLHMAACADTTQSFAYYTWKTVGCWHNEGTEGKGRGQTLMTGFKKESCVRVPCLPDRVRSASERLLSSHDLIQHHSKAEDICLLRASTRCNQFRRHPMKCSSVLHTHSW